MWFGLTLSYWNIQKLKSSGRKNGQFSRASATLWGTRRYTDKRQYVQYFLSQLGQKSHYFNKKTGWFPGEKRPVFDVKVAELFRKSGPFGHKCKFCLPSHGHAWPVIFYFVRKSVQKWNDTLTCKRANYKARQHAQKSPKGCTSVTVGGTPTDSAT